MSSVRFRNDKYYYRATIRDQNGTQHWIEHGSFDTYEEALSAGNFAYPRKRKNRTLSCTSHVVDLVFERFPKNHPAYIPLKFIYYYDLTPKEVYNIKIRDIDLSNSIFIVDEKEYVLSEEMITIVSNHIDKILKNRMTFLCDNSGYLNVYFPSGKRVLYYQMDYVTKVLRREVNPNWNWRDFRYKSVSQK